MLDKVHLRLRLHQGDVVFGEPDQKPAARAASGAFELPVPYQKVYDVVLEHHIAAQRQQEQEEVVRPAHDNKYCILA